MKTKQLRVISINGYLGYEKKWLWITDYYKGYNTGRYYFRKEIFSDSVYNEPCWNITYDIGSNRVVVSSDNLLSALKKLKPCTK